jgi:hypothetical protein
LKNRSSETYASIMYDISSSEEEFGSWIKIAWRLDGMNK